MTLNPKSYILNPAPRRGLTLLELLVSISITSLLFVLIAGTLTNLIIARQKINRNLTVQKLVDQTLLVLTQEARWAIQISSTSSSLSFTTETQNISYALNGTNLVKTTSQLQGNPQATTENINPPNYKITQFSITNRSQDLNRPSYEINLTISHRPPQPNSPTLTYANHTALTIRNRFPGSEL